MDDVATTVAVPTMYEKLGQVFDRGSGITQNIEKIQSNRRSVRLITGHRRLVESSRTEIVFNDFFDIR